MFVAARLPEALVEELDAFLDPRREAGLVRWTPPEQWHITLAFAAAVPTGRVEDLRDALGTVADRSAPVPLTVAGAGAVPSPYAAKALWLRADADDPAALERLARRCRTAISRCGVAVQGGDFVPHLTVARSRTPVEATRLLRVLDAAPPLRGMVAEMALVESGLGQGPGGRARHTVVEAFPLAEG